MTLVQPNEDMQAFVRKELNEDLNTRDSDLQAIKEWLAKQPHLPDAWGEFWNDLEETKFGFFFFGLLSWNRLI